MADFIQELADNLARDVLETSREMGDAFFYEQIAKVIGESSPTLQDAFMTSIRIRLADKRARDFMARAVAAKKTGAPPPAAPRAAEQGGH